MRPQLSTSAAFGFSLAEFLIASAIGAVILASVTSMAVSHIRASATQVKIQRLRSDWRRLQDLINVEVSESKFVSIDPNLIRLCDAEGENKKLLFLMRVPTFTQGSNTFGALTDYTIIYYTDKNSGVSQLRRCGPSVNDDGTLNFANLIGRNQFGGIAPGSVVLEGIQFDPVLISPDGRTLTINPANPIPNAVTSFTVRSKVEGSL